MPNTNSKDLQVDTLFLESTYSNVKSNGVSNQDDYTTNYGIEKLKRDTKSFIIQSLDDNLNTITNINNVSELIDGDVDRLNWKINQAIEKVKGAILAERRMTGVVYTNIVPINTGMDNNTTTATISDNIILGILNTTNNNYLTNVQPLLTSNIKITDATNNQINYQALVNNKLSNFTITPIKKSQTVIEITINIQRLVENTSSIVVNLKDHQILEVLKNSNLFQSKTLSNNFTIPVDNTDTTVVLRFYPIINRPTPISFNMLGLTNLIYQTEVEFETSSININQPLTYLSLDTCDNSNNKNVSIEYYLSIDGSTYERIAPTSKVDAKTIQSIVTLDKSEEISLLPILGNRISQSNIQFYLPTSIVNSVVYEITTYLPYLGNSAYSVLYASLANDTVINRTAMLSGNSSSKLYIDGILITDEVITLLKGMRSILATDSMNNILNIDYTYFSNIVGSTNIYINKNIKQVTSNGLASKFVTFNESELLVSTDFTLPDSNIDKYKIFVTNVSQSVNVGNIKIKGILNSLDNITCPYISRIIIKGV